MQREKDNAIDENQPGISVPKGGCTPGAKLRYAWDARDARLHDLQLPL